MNFLRSLNSKLRQAKTNFKTNYLRNSDSKALKSSEFKALLPFVLTRKSTNLIHIAYQKDNANLR